jgi:hypothetical protein
MSRSAATTVNALIGLLLLAAVVAGLFAVLQLDPWGAGQTVPPPEQIDPAVIGYEQTAEIAVPLREVRALAVDADDRIYVGGDRAILVFSSAGVKEREIPLRGEPKCLAVAGKGHAFPGRLYAGMESHVEVLSADGKAVGNWKPIEKASLTSIAVGNREVFVADAGNRIVWRYNPDGTQKGRIDGRGKDSGQIGFIITSHYFDLALGRDELLYVVNPRRLRIEAYASDGTSSSHWGEAGTAVEGFYGCCNPAHVAILPDERFVTAEKGISRIKVYDADHKFECVVAGPQQMSSVAADLAADSRGRVLVLDDVKRCVRVFEPKTDAASLGDGQ